MFNATIDLGQVILGSIIAIIGFFVKRELTTLSARLDKHDDMLLEVVGDLRELRGIMGRRLHDKS